MIDTKKRTKRKKYTDGALNIVPLTLIILVASITYYGLTGGEENPTYNRIITATRYFSYLLAFFLFVIRPKRAIRIKNNPPFLILGFYFLISTAWSQNLNIVAVNFVHYIGTGVSAFLAAQYFLSMDNSLSKAYWPTLYTVILVPSLLVILLLPEYGGTANIDESIVEFNEGRWAGVTGSANMLGVECMIALWAAVSGLLSSPKKKTKLLCLSLATISIALLIGTHSASSLIGSLAVVFLLVFLSRYSKVSKENRKKIILGLSYLFVTIGIVLIFILPSMLSLDKSTAALGKDSTFTGRTLLWDEAKEMIAIKPWLGWGFDNRVAVKEERWINVNNYHNGYLDIMVRGGLIGFGILCFMYAWYAYKVLAMKSLDFQRNIPYISVVLSALIYNIGEVTFAFWTHGLWIIMLFSLFMVNKPRIKRRRESAFVMTPSTRRARSIFKLPNKKRKRRKKSAHY